VFCLRGGGDIALVKSLPDYCITVLSVKSSDIKMSSVLSST